MSRCWLALTEGPVKSARASARVSTLDGHAGGTLAAWCQRAKPVRDALRVDERLIDPNGAPHFEGAITVARSPDAKWWLRDDPFARILPRTLLAVDAGILGTVAAPTGPTIERYGSGNPWPWDRFS